jgi:uncharacterized repeat protein (TIGR01451 family)
MLFVMVTVTLSPVIATNSTEPQWMQLGHDNQNTGQSPYQGPQNNTTKWNYTPPDVNSGRMSDPVVGADGTVYITTGFEDDKVKIYALNPNGTERWNYTAYEEGWAGSISDLSIGLDGTVYSKVVFAKEYMEQFTRIYALNPDKTLKWIFNLTDGNIGGLPSNYICSPIMDKNGTLYFSNEFTEEEEDNVFGNIYALSSNGTVKWNFTLPGVICGISPLAIGSDGTIYVTSICEVEEGYKTTLYAIKDAKNKVFVKWMYTISQGELQHRSNTAPLIAKDGTIYQATNIFNSTENKEYAFIYAFNPSGNLKWIYKLNETEDTWINDISDYALALGPDNTIYFNTIIKNESLEFGKLFALKDLGTIVDTLWNFSTSNAERFSSVIVGGDGKIYIGKFIDDTIDPIKFYALNPDGSVKWIYKIASRFNEVLIEFSSASISSDGTLYIKNHQKSANQMISSMLYAIKGPQADLYVNTGVNNKNPKIGDIIKITFKIGNKGPDEAYNTIFKYVIPKGLKYLNAIVDMGTVSYDSTTRTITWNLGNVSVGDPYLYLYLQVLKAGTYKIQPSVSTLTYDPKLSSSISTIIINAQPKSGSTGSKTVGMQNTGLPLGMLVLAILMVLGLSVKIKKK